MPTPDRKPRARHVKQAAKLSWEDIHDTVLRVAGDAEAWAKVRPLVISSLESSTVTAEQAAGIADACWRRPLWMGVRPPRKPEA